MDSFRRAAINCWNSWKSDDGSDDSSDDPRVVLKALLDKESDGGDDLDIYFEGKKID